MNYKLRLSGCDHLTCQLLENNKRMIFNLITLNQDQYRLDITAHNIEFSLIRGGQSAVTTLGRVALT